MNKELKITPEIIQNIRLSAGLTQKEVAEIMGYTLNGWQKKELKGKGNRGLSFAEFEYFQLRLDAHPVYKLIIK